MSDRDGFQPGVPCWVACVQADPEKGVSFYERKGDVADASKARAELEDASTS
jgi:hypothetical protein